MKKHTEDHKRPDDSSSHQRRNLTKLEVEILALVAVGATNKEIADRLNTDPQSVKNALSNIFKKIEVSNRFQAALWAAKNL